MAQDLVNFQKLHLEPAMAVLASDVENDVLSGCTKATYNIVGTPGTPTSSLAPANLARGRLNQYLAPNTPRAIQMDSITMGELVNGVAAYFNPSNAISEQYREGMVARTAMADYYENNRTYVMARGTQVSTWTDTFTIGEGQVSTTVSSATSTFSVGDCFTIGHASSVNAIYACHPETKAAYGHRQTFVVTGTSGATNIQFQPAIRISGARKNVCRANGSDLIVSSLTTIIVIGVGGPASSYPQPLMYNRDAFTFATAPLPLMDDAIRCVVKTYDGISLRVWEASDIRNDEKLTRIDILYGYAAIRPQWACRLIGTGA